MKLKRAGSFLVCLCLAMSLLPIPARAEDSEAFRVLEIVDNMKSASAGWYIAGEEPMDYMSALISQGSESARREYLLSVRKALESRGLAGTDGPIQLGDYAEARPWEEHEGMTRLALDHTEFVSVRGLMTSSPGGGWSTYGEDGADYIFVGEGGGEFSFIPSEFAAPVALAYYTVYVSGAPVNRELFKRAAFGLSEEECGMLKVELTTLLSGRVTESDIDSADLVLLCADVSQTLRDYIADSDTPMAEYPEGFSTSAEDEALYALCAGFSPVSLMAAPANTVTVLDIEPRTGTASITASDVASWLAGDISANDVSIDCMSVAEFIGSTKDLREYYDLIYIGSSKTNISPPDKEPDYNDDEMDGSYYNGYKDNNGNGDLTNSNNTRYTAFDLTLKKVQELNDYTASGYPVVVSDTLLTNGPETTFEVTLNPTYINLVIARILYEIEAIVTYTPAANAPPTSEVHYQWWRTKTQLENNSTSSTYVRGSNNLVDIGWFQCEVTIYGQTAMSATVYGGDIIPGTSGFDEKIGSFQLNTVNTPAVQSSTYMYSFLDGVKDLKNVRSASAAVTSPLALQGPGLTLNSPNTADVTTITNGKLALSFSVEEARGYSYQMFIDSDLNDKFNEAAVDTGTVSKGVNNISYTLPEGTTGLVPWRLVVTDGTHYDAVTGYSYVQGFATISVYYAGGKDKINIPTGKGYSFTIANSLAECSVIVVTSKEALTEDVNKAINDGKPVVYLNNITDSSLGLSNDKSSYTMMKDNENEGIRYISPGITDKKAYFTDYGSVTNTGSITMWPYTITGSTSLAGTSSENHLATVPGHRIDVPIDGTVWMCLAPSGNKLGDAFSYIPNDVRNDYLLYTVGQKVYLGLKTSQLTTAGEELLANAVVYAARKTPEAGGGTVEFVSKYGTSISTAYFASDEFGMAVPELQRDVHFKADVSGRVTGKFKYYEGNSTDPTGSVDINIMPGDNRYRITQDILDKIGNGADITVSVEIDGGGSDTLKLRKMTLLPLT